jgi:tetratricopeptide (TPR) repeat protein
MNDQLRTMATAALDRGEWRTAQAFGARMLAQSPADPDAYYVAGVAELRLEQPVRAIEYLRRAALLAPAWPEPLAELSRAYLSTGMAPVAAQIAERAMAMAPANGVTLDMLGVIFGQAGLHERARAAFEAAVERMPANAASRFNLASTLAFGGHLDAAEEQLEACLALDPRHWRAHLFLSQLRRQTANRNHLERLRSILAEPPEWQGTFYLNLAIAKELEDLGRYAEAFAHLTAGKTSAGAERGYSPARDASAFEEIVKCFPVPVAEHEGNDNAEPIFVIGMPRSGTTLVERILSSHPMVRSAGELRNFMVALDAETGGVPGFIFNEAFAESARHIDYPGLAARYLDSVQHLRGTEPHFIDKLPHNFLFAGFIAQALPRAKIVCLRRNAVDTCLSNFRQVFDLRSPYFDYSFDLLDTGRYYLLFDRLMSHWQRVFPGRILEVQYEDLVTDQEANTRRLLEFCGLPWNEACLSFERNQAPVATASAVQVRAAMNRNSIDRWKHYEPQLAGLLRLLAEGGIPHR